MATLHTTDPYLGILPDVSPDNPRDEALRQYDYWTIDMACELPSDVIITLNYGHEDDLPVYFLVFRHPSFPNGGVQVDTFREVIL